MSEQTGSNNQTCVHCGDSCGKQPIVWNGKPFCCTGCQTVYQLLNENKLGNYYQLDAVPGIKLNDTEAPSDDKYAFLDLPEIQEKLLDFSDGQVAKLRFFIPGIHCASCIWLLENLRVLHSGVLVSSVNFPKKEVSITFKPGKISLRQLVELLASIHYIPEINPQQSNEPKGLKSNRKLLLKIGIAGFSFLNTMIYHFPQYLPGADELGSNFRTLFGWLSFLLSIPVLLYCASDYFLSAYKSLRKRIISIDLPIALGLITLFLQSSFEVLSEGGIGYFDSLTGLVFFLLIGKWYQGISYEALTFERNYKSYFPVAVTKLTDSGKETIPLEKLQAGDRILVRNQELIPADAVIEAGQANIDYSFVTGESIPVSKNTGDFVFAGGRQSGSSIELLVQKEVEQSYLTQLWNQSPGQSEDEHGMHSLINKVSQYFTLIIISIALAAGIYWQLQDPSKSVFAFTSVLIIACPCALALTIPFTFGSTMRQFGRKGFYLKNAAVIEKLVKTSTVVFDKTGTITHAQTATVQFIGKELSKSEQAIIRSLCKHSSHPLSKTLFDQLPASDLLEVKDYTEIPSLGISGELNGHPVLLGSHFFVAGKPADEEDLTTTAWLSIDHQVLGYFRFENKYREGLQETIGELSKNYSLHLISGDNESERAKLLPLFKEQARLNFKQSPTDKLQYIKNLQNNGENTLMIGDGLNDAGALMESKVGLVIADNIYNFTPACDAILQAGKFGRLNRFIRFTKTAMTIVWLSFAISFIYNIVGISFAVSGNLSPIVAAILMPLSSVTVVAFATFAVKFSADKAML